MLRRIWLRTFYTRMTRFCAARRVVRRRPRTRGLWSQAAPLEARVLLSAAAVGTEFQVNTFTSNNQQTFSDAPQSVAMDADGDFLVTWSSFGQDGSRWGIYAQRYNADGVAQGSEFRVNTTTANDQLYSAAAMDADGDFVITWSSYDNVQRDVYAQRYNAAGVAQGGEFIVNSTTAGEQLNSTVAMDADGDFVVTWMSFGQDGDAAGVYAQRYNAAGVAQGGEFLVNTTTAGNQSNSTVAMDDDGDFVVSWTGNDVSGRGVYAQRYNAAGVAQGVEFAVNTYITLNQQFSAIAMDADGDFVVSWSSQDQDLGGFGIYAQRYNASGVAQGGEFRVNVATAADQQYSTVAMDADGDFVVTWSSNGQDGSGQSVYARQYNAAGVPEGGESQVNTATAGDQQYSGVAMDDNGDFVIAWTSYQDGNGSSVHAQRYEVLNSPPTALSLTGNTVAENQPVGAAVGTFSTTDPDLLNTFTYTLVSGSGDTGNGSFQIVGDQLQTNASFNYELQSIYTIRVRTTDQGGLWTEEDFIITVTDVNEAPTAVVLSGETTSLPENTSTATAIDVATISVTDDSLGTNVLSLSGVDAGVFEIVGNTLRVKAGTVLDFETQSSYSVTVDVDDAAVGGPVDASVLYTLSLTNVNETPTALSLTGNTVAENQPVGTPVGTFSTTDPDAVNSFTYTLVSGLGDTGNGSFQIVSNQLETNASFNFEAQSSYSVRVRTTDQGGLWTEQDFTITVTDVNDVPTAASQTVSVTEDGTTVIVLHGADDETPEASLVFTITSLPSKGVLLDSMNQPVVVGQTFTGSPQLTFLNGAEIEAGQSTSFTFTVKDPSASVSAPATVQVDVTAAVGDGLVTIDGNGVVRIAGTTGNDTLVVTTSSGNLIVTLNSVVISNSIPTSSISEIHVWGRTGNDVINTGSLSIPVLLWGGAGNDTLTGGSKGDLIFGGDGDDVVTGSGGDDFLTGGDGKDRVVGSSGNDILIAGRVGDTTSLLEARVTRAMWANLWILAPIMSDIEDSVIDEVNNDKLTGGSGWDWFIVSPGDQITDLSPFWVNGDFVTYV